MSLLSRFLLGARHLFTRDAAHRDLNAEVEYYLEESIAAKRAGGLTPHEAERLARAELGSLASVQEPARQHGWDATVATLGQDIRYAVRYLTKSPGFTIAAVASLALGIGANTAIFSMINATLLKRLPVERSDELVTVMSPSGSGSFSYPAFDDLRRQAGTVLDGLTGFGSIAVSLSAGDGADLVNGSIVTGNYFQVLGIRAARGRLLQPSDDVTPGAHPVAVISETFWRTRLGARDDIVGLDVRLNGQPYTVIGVVPTGFNGTRSPNVSDVFVPMMMQAWMRPPRAGYSGEMDPDLLGRRGSTWIAAVGRLKPGVSIGQAESGLTSIARAMPDWTRLQDSLRRVQVARLEDGPPGQRDQLASVARLLGAVVATVLIIACANVANLLLARAGSRRKEIAVRLSIGATRRRLVRQLLTESVLLAALGGAVGLFLAWAAIRAMRASPPPAGALPVSLDFSIDWTVLAFTMMLSIITGVVFGLVPALRASRPDLVPALKDQLAPTIDGNRWLNPRNTLVVAQVALSLVLLIASGLFVRSLTKMQSLTPGFAAERLLTVPLNIQLLRYTSDQGRNFYRDVIERVEAVPGVESATIARWLPLTGGSSIASLEIEGQEPQNHRFFAEGGTATDDPNVVLTNNVGTRYLETMGIRLVRGRNFSESDQPNSPRVAIVTEQFARRHFGDADPIGKRIALNGHIATQGLEIIGVAADAKYGTLDESTSRLVYTLATQNHVNGMVLIVRARRNPADLTNEIAQVVYSIDRSLPVAGARTYEDWIGISLYAARAGASLLTAFGVLALLLAAVGLYGVLAYAVSRRTREFGLRMALGAKAGTVLRLVVGEGMGLVAFGVAGGLMVALSVTRLLARFLYGVSPTDGWTFAWTPVALFAVAAVACLLPALRATRVDPIKALKED